MVPQELVMLGFMTLGFGMGILPMLSVDMQTNEDKVQKAEKPVPEQIELLCIEQRRFVRDHFGDGSLVQVGEGSSNSVPCKD